jgi:hypothetical protein
VERGERVSGCSEIIQRLKKKAVFIMQLHAAWKSIFEKKHTMMIRNVTP